MLKFVWTDVTTPSMPTPYRPLSWPIEGPASYRLIDLHGLLSPPVQVALKAISPRAIAFSGPELLLPGTRLSFEMSSPRRALPLIAEVRVQSSTPKDRAYLVHCEWAKPLEFAELILFI